MLSALTMNHALRTHHEHCPLIASGGAQALQVEWPVVRFGRATRNGAKRHQMLPASGAACTCACNPLTCSTSGAVLVPCSCRARCTRHTRLALCPTFSLALPCALPLHSPYLVPYLFTRLTLYPTFSPALPCTLPFHPPYASTIPHLPHLP